MVRIGFLVRTDLVKVAIIGQCQVIIMRDKIGNSRNQFVFGLAKHGATLAQVGEFRGDETDQVCEVWASCTKNVSPVALAIGLVSAPQELKIEGYDELSWQCVSHPFAHRPSGPSLSTSACRLRRHSEGISDHRAHDQGHTKRGSPLPRIP